MLDPGKHRCQLGLVLPGCLGSLIMRLCLLLPLQKRTLELAFCLLNSGSRLGVADPSHGYVLGAWHRSWTTSGS